MRIRVITLLVMFVSLAGYAGASTCDPPSTGAVSVDQETITVSTAAVALTNSKVSPPSSQGPTMAIITSETDTVRFWASGTAPTSTTGHIILSGGQLVICGNQNLKNFKAIRGGSSDATLQVSYYRFN